MSATALMLVLVSVCLHAGWNVLGKSRVPSLTFFALATAAGGLALAPLLWLGPPLGELPWRFWGWLAATGLCQTLYLGGLAWAYARGEMSVLYPLARALPVLVVPLVTVGLLGSRVVNGWDITGFVLVVLGALCLPLANRQAFQLSTYMTPALGFALLAAVSTAGYSLIDKQALELMLAADYSSFTAGAVYIVLQALATCLWAVPIILMMPTERGRLPRLWASEKRRVLVAGLMIQATYGLVLVALAMTEEVSYVVAMRQLSIPLGVLIGIMWLRERATPFKLLGTGIIVLGLWLVAYQ